MTVPDLSGFRFTATHEWVETVDGGARVGITDFAQAQLGDVIFLEMPEVGTTLKAGDRFGVIESVKAASDLFVPVGGRVAEVNGALADAPERVNTDPYGEGWILRLEDVDEAGASLLDEAAYTRLTT
ncbi:MAG: glycine cleavage system protein GcvH [Chloroflexi bacterium]|nr:MAG: glycine cleavage system protein GcvH [Chloroflexota bacterium]TMD97670.1 MAG: glycine cleavage system protein GcvH [Chloroflexota bacterium]